MLEENDNKDEVAVANNWKRKFNQCLSFVKVCIVGLRDHFVKMWHDELYI